MKTSTIVGITHTISVFSILVALEKFRDLGIDRFIAGGQDEEQQALLLSLLPEARKVSYRESDIQAFASSSISALNQILEKHGFDIRLNESADLGVVTIMDLVAQWLTTAAETTVTYEDVSYPAMVVKEGASVAHTEYGEILKLRTKNGITVHIQKAEQELSGLELFMHALELSKAISGNEKECWATLPFVTIDEQPDISWLTGMVDQGMHLMINQAVQQNRLVINLNGIHAQSATAIALRKGILITEKSYIVDQPFYISMAYDENPFPLFTSYVTPAQWKYAE